MTTLPLFGAVEEAALALRRGWPVRVTNAQRDSAFSRSTAVSEIGSLVILSAETFTRERLSSLVKSGDGATVDALITHPRATTLKIRLYTPDVVAIPLAHEPMFETMTHLADPTADLAHPLMGPFHARRDKLSPAHAAAVKLAKLAGLLPAVVARVANAADNHLPTVDAASISAYDDAHAYGLKAVARARLPLAGAGDSEIIAFRASDGGPEHLALLISKPQPPGPVLVRLHSECFTGDLLGSLKCDCGEQLQGAIRAIAAAGGGVLLYLAQEGRGIGLMNKLRAYALQDQGFDTVEANLRLGFDEDERLFRPAATMLRALGFSSVRLLTNNPDKARALAAMGINVRERVPHAFPSNPHNAHYLATKRNKSGHDL